MSSSNHAIVTETVGAMTVEECKSIRDNFANQSRPFRAMQGKDWISIAAVDVQYQCVDIPAWSEVIDSMIN
ncbi:MAG: hypothetical protein ACEQSB_00720 [Undibacterium sp.]